MPLADSRGDHDFNNHAAIRRMLLSLYNGDGDDEPPLSREDWVDLAEQWDMVNSPTWQKYYGRFLNRITLKFRGDDPPKNYFYCEQRIQALVNEIIPNAIFGPGRDQHKSNMLASLRRDTKEVARQKLSAEDFHHWYMEGIYYYLGYSNDIWDTLDRETRDAVSKAQCYHVWYRIFQGNLARSRS